MTVSLEKGGVTRPDLGHSSAGLGKIGREAVGDQHLRDGAVDEQSFFPGAVTRDAYGSDAGAAGKVDSHAVGGDKIADRSVRARHIRPGKVLGKHVRRDVIGSDHLDENTINNEKFAERAVRARHIHPLSLWGYHIDYMSWRKISGGLNNLVAPGGFDGDVATRTATGVEWRPLGGYWEKIRSTPFVLGAYHAPQDDGDGTILRVDPGKNLDRYTNVWIQMEQEHNATPTIMPRYMLDLGINASPGGTNAKLLSGVIVGIRNNPNQIVFVRAVSSTQLEFTTENPSTFPTFPRLVVKDVWGEVNFSRVTTSGDYDDVIDDILTPEERRVKEILEIIRKIINPPDPSPGGGTTPPPPTPAPDTDDGTDTNTPGTQIPDTDDTNDRQPPPPTYEPNPGATPQLPPPVDKTPTRPRQPTPPYQGGVQVPDRPPDSGGGTPDPDPDPDPGDTDTDDNYRYEERPETPGGGISLPPVSGIGTPPQTGTPGGGGNLPVTPGDPDPTRPEETANPNRTVVTINPDGSVTIVRYSPETTTIGEDGEPVVTNPGGVGGITELTKEEVEKIGGVGNIVKIDKDKDTLASFIGISTIGPIGAFIGGFLFGGAATVIDGRDYSVVDNRPPPPPAVGVQPSPGGGGGGYIPPGYQPPSQEEYDNYWS